MNIYGICILGISATLMGCLIAVTVQYLIQSSDLHKDRGYPKHRTNERNYR